MRVPLTFKLRQDYIPPVRNVHNVPPLACDTEWGYLCYHEWWTKQYKPSRYPHISIKRSPTFRHEGLQRNLFA